ncbi:MAG: hypothetical protein NT076_02035 [Candidatus Pacearchaeota archaeon]|nr:hypothetical protein [Candidatus Pacearchaeota archaeon]
MTQLECLEDLHTHLVCQNIRSLQKIIAGSPRPKKYKRWLEIEKRVQEQYKVPSLQDWLLYEHQFGRKCLRDLGKELGVSESHLYNLMEKMNIPRRNKSESMIGERNLGYNKIGRKDKQALIDLIKEEIEAHRAGNLEKLSTNAELAQLLHVHPNSITNYLSGILEEDREYRINGY